MSPVLHAAEGTDRLLGGPGDQMRDAWRDLLATTRAQVGLARGGRTHRPDQPLAVRVLLESAGAVQRSVAIDHRLRGRLAPGAATGTVAARHPIRVTDPSQTGPGPEPAGSDGAMLHIGLDRGPRRRQSRSAALLGPSLGEVHALICLVQQVLER